MNDTQEFAPQHVEVMVQNGNLDVHNTAADYGGYQTYVLASTDKPQRILRSDPNRSRAYITVAGTGPVWIGTESQCEQIFSGMSQSAGMISGGYIATGITLIVTHKQDLWLVPDGTHSATVTVSNERWA